MEVAYLQKVGSKCLDLLGERGTEQQSLAVAWWGHATLLHDLPDLGLETHIKHAISLIQSQELDL